MVCYRKNNVGEYNQMSSSKFNLTTGFRSLANRNCDFVHIYIACTELSHLWVSARPLLSWGPVQALLGRSYWRFSQLINLLTMKHENPGSCLGALTHQPCTILIFAEFLCEPIKFTNLAENLPPKKWCIDWIYYWNGWIRKGSSEEKEPTGGQEGVGWEHAK